MSTEQNLSPWPTLPPSLQLFMMSEGVVIATALFLVAELGIADLLANDIHSSEELAQATSTRKEALYRTLRMLSAVGVFTETQPDHFDLTPIGQLLQSGIPGSMRAWVRMVTDKTWLHTYAESLHSLQTGMPAFKRAVGADFFDYLADNREYGAIFDEAMNDITRGSNAAIVEGYDFTSMRTLVDVGSGHGLLMMAILDAHPEIKGILFDLPHVAAGGFGG